MKAGIVIAGLLLVVGFSSAQEGKSLGAEAAAPIGLALGQTAPAFSAIDQFGRSQSKETLKGPRGTILLFFRSADW